MSMTNEEELHIVQTINTVDGYTYWWARDEKWLVINHNHCKMEAIVVGDNVSDILFAIIEHKCGEETESNDVHWRPEE